jgi:hypothetical protein
MSELDGMTVNERLYARGLMAAWDVAVLKKDCEAMIKLLDQVELADDAPAIADSVLNQNGQL